MLRISGYELALSVSGCLIDNYNVPRDLLLLYYIAVVHFTPTVDTEHCVEMRGFETWTICLPPRLRRQDNSKR